MEHVFHKPFAQRLQSFFDAAPDSLSVAAGFMSDQEIDTFYSEVKKTNPGALDAMGPRKASPFSKGRAAILKYPTSQAEKWAVQNGGRYGLKVDPKNPWLVRPLGEGPRSKKDKFTADDLLEAALGDLFYGGDPFERSGTGRQTPGKPGGGGTTRVNSSEIRTKDYSPEDWPPESDPAAVADRVFALAMQVWQDVGIATTMTAISLSESGGRSIFSGTDVDSRGLWQINLEVHEQPLIDAGIIETPADLWDPETNAIAAEYVGRGSSYRSHTAPGSVDLSRWSVTHGGLGAPYLENRGKAEAARDRANISGVFGSGFEGDWNGRVDIRDTTDFRGGL